MRRFERTATPFNRRGREKTPAGGLMLVPFALAALWYGNCVRRRVSRDSVLQLLSTPLLPIGASSLVRVSAG